MKKYLIPKYLSRETQINVVNIFIKESCKINPEYIYEKGRKQEIAEARFMAWYVFKTLFGWSYPMIGKQFNRHYSSIIHGVAKVKKNKWDLGIVNQVVEILNRF